MIKKYRDGLSIGDDPIEQWISTAPENKLELIDGKLAICDLKGSRRIAWELLADYGPMIGLNHAPAKLWWQALEQAYQLSPIPVTHEERWRWAQQLSYDPTPPPAGPNVTVEHRRVFETLRWGLYAFLGLSGLGKSYGRDIVVKLDENALTPDLFVFDYDRFDNMTENYFKGPPTIAIEVTQPNTVEFDREVKFRLHEKAGTPEYWLFDPFARTAEFWRLKSGRYERVETEPDAIYRSAALSGLALVVPEVWTLDGRSRIADCRPFLDESPSLSRRAKETRPPREYGWDSLPFAPRVGLEPYAIRFEEFISWCGEAKFEGYGKGLTISGTEGTLRVFGMLMMTFGLTEIVRLAHPRDWVIFLAPRLHPRLDEGFSELMKRATFNSREFGDETFWSGTIDKIPWVSSHGKSEQECREVMAENVRQWILLSFARAVDGE